MRILSPKAPNAPDAAKAPVPPDARERVIDAAIGLMRRSGFSGAGINEIIKESGAPKGSLYHYFPDGKRAIASAALAVYSERVAAVLEQALSGGRSPAAKVKRLFDVFAARLESSDCRQSCAAGAASLDLDDDLEAVRATIAAAFDAWIEVIARHLPFGDPRRARSFAGLVLTTIEGAYVRGRAEHSSAAFREAGTWLARLAEHEANS